MVLGGWELNMGILASTEEQMSSCAAQRRPHLKCYRMEPDHKEGLGRHRDWEENCPEGARETEKGLGT